MDKYQQFANENLSYAKAAFQVFGILPEIVLAQAAHESNFGQSYSARNDKNYFGLSASTFFNSQYWNGKDKRKTSDTAGYYRVYSSVKNSFLDFAWLLSNASRYASVKANFKNPDGYIKAIIASGYFTGNKTAYSNALTNNINKFKPLLGSSGGSGVSDTVVILGLAAIIYIKKYII